MQYALETLTRVVAAPHTKWSIVYDIAKREIWYRSAVSPTVKHVALRSFDFSCEGPLLMLDVNTPMGGNVEKSFAPYDRDLNLAAFQTLCARYGIEVSEEDANALMSLFDGFRCARQEHR